MFFGHEIGSQALSDTPVILEYAEFQGGPFYLDFEAIQWKVQMLFFKAATVFGRKVVLAGSGTDFHRSRELNQRLGTKQLFLNQVYTMF